LTENDTSKNPLPRQQHHMLPLPLMPQQFDKEFWALQQQIQEQHLILDAKIQSFLAFFEQQQHNNLSQTVSSPCERNPTIDARFSHPAIFRYFFDIYCSPTLPETHWYHHRTRRSNSQNNHRAMCNFFSTNGRQPPHDDNSTIPPPPTMT